MKKCRFFIRVDSGTEIGTGHAIRCMSLAYALKKMNFEPCFISKKNRGNISKFFIDHGFMVYYIKNSCLKLKKNENIIDDVNQTVKIITKHKSKSPLLLVDHYDLDFKWEKNLRKHVDKIIVIDDLARKHDCDLLLDQNYHKNSKTRYDKLVPRKCVKLLGPKYALLRTEFSNLRKNNVKPRKIFNNVLISFGGSDPTNETEKVLSAIKILKNKKQFKEINVVITNSNRNKNKIRQICNSIPHTKFYQNVYDIGKLMCKADLAVGAGGSSTWERFCLGLPAIVSIVSNNQYQTTRVLAKKELLINVGLAKNLTIKKYVKIFENLDTKKLRNISKNSLNVVDGNGSFRVAKEIRLLQST